jgi:phospholipid transport system substrate-binding protein
MDRAKMALGRRQLLASTFGVASALLPARRSLADASTAGAEAVVRNLAEQAWALVHRGDLDKRQRIDQLTDLIESQTDVPLLSRLVLGRYWPQLSEAQRAEYERLFRVVVMRGFARRLNDYAHDTTGPLEQHFRIVAGIVTSDKDILVRSKVQPERGQPVNVDWRLRRRDDRPVIIDLIVEGVSLLVSQRSEFASVIERSNMDGFLAELRARAESAES